MRLPTHCSIHLSPYLKFKIYSLNIKVNLPQNLVCIEKHFSFHRKYSETRSHTDNFGENNVKCLIAKGICRFVPHSSAGGF